MAHYCYQGVPSTAPPSPNVTVQSGGSITSAKAGDYYFWMQLRNLAGYGLPSPSSGKVTIAAGQKFSITIPSSARPSPNGCYIWGFYILASRTNDITQASIVCSQPGYDIDGATLVSLPTSISLSYDEHLEISKTVLGHAALPTGSNRVHGMRRDVQAIDPDEVSEMLEWDSRDNTWKPTVEGFNTSVSDINGPLGATRDLAVIDAATVIAPVWAIDPTVPHRPLRYWLVNDTTQVIPSGTNVSLRVKNGINDISTVSGIAGGIELQFLGYASTSTGVLDTTGMTVGVPITYDGPLTPLTLQKDLDPDSAYVLQIKCQFNKFQLGRRPGQNSFLEFQPEFTVDKAVYNPVDGFGSYISPRYKFRRIVPETGLSVLALKGSGAIALEEGGSLNFNSAPVQPVPGLAANTAGQYCLIGANGTCYISPTLPTSGSELRAIVGTLDGIGNSSGWSLSTIPLNGTVLLQVALTHPTMIRNNYPDVIAGSLDGEYNATQVAIYVQPVGGGTITRFTAMITPGIASESVTVGGTAGVPVGSSLPTAPSPDFGFYEYSTSSFTLDIVAGTSVFSSGTYHVAIAPVYANTATSISHSPVDGCIPEILIPIAEAVQNTIYTVPPLTEAALRALTRPIPPWKRYYIQEWRREVHWDPMETGAETGSGVIKLDGDSNASLGRFVVDLHAR